MKVIQQESSDMGFYKEQWDVHKEKMFFLLQAQAEIRLPKTQGIAGHVATTGKNK